MSGHRHDEHGERQMEIACGGVSHHDPAPRQPDHNRIVPTEVPQGFAQPPSRIKSIFEKRSHGRVR